MNLRIFVISIILLVSKTAFSQNIDISSVKYFYNVSDKIASGKSISEQEWEHLFETSGYKISAQSDVRKKVIRNMMNFAYDATLSAEKDSILNIDIMANFNNNELLLNSLTIQNYIDMQQNDVALREFLKKYDFESIENQSIERLKEVLINPIDSLITFPSVNILCYEPDAQSKPKGIVIDYNYFFKNNGANDDFLAHEMYHTYRRNFEKQEYINTNNFTFQLNNLHNEGVADQIDKNKDVSKHFEKQNYPKKIIQFYETAYNETPSLLEKFEQITLSFIHKEIDEETFNKKLTNFFSFGGHPNGFYMTSLIVEAGLRTELFEKFYNPHDFLVLYNKAAKKLDGFVFCDEVMEYSNELANKYYR